MAKVKEIYLWIILFAAIAIGSVYFRYYYQPQLSLNVSFANSTTSVYPYQQAGMHVVVRNTGASTISNMSLGLYVNGNITRTYRITIPGGENASMSFNLTPAYSGTYNITVIADPSKLYYINNRNSSRASEFVDVMPADTANPGASFTSNGLVSEDIYRMSTSGYGFTLFLANDTGAQEFLLTPFQNLNNLLYPTLDVYYSYVKDIAVGHAYYKNYSMVSVWLKGYLTPNAIATVAVGKGLNVSYNGSLDVIGLGSNTTMCTWYSGGWVKALAVVNSSRSCAAFVDENSSRASKLEVGKFVYGNLSIYNYSGYFSNYTYTGQWSIVNKSFLFQSVSTGPNFTNICYGNIEQVDNISYCSTYYLEPQNTILVKTNAILGTYNFTTWALTNNLTVINQTRFDKQLVGRYNITSPSSQFVSGFVNSCYINGKIGCYGSSWNYNSLSLGLINEYNSTVRLESAGCYTEGAQNYTQIGQTLAPGGYTYITIPCYQNGTRISGVPLGLQVYLNLTYQVSNSTLKAIGDAKLVK